MLHVINKPFINIFFKNFEIFNIQIVTFNAMYEKYKYIIL